MAIDRTKIPRDHIAKVVQQGRLRHGWSKEEAARKAGISSITWKRMEDGLTVQDEKLTAALRVVGVRVNIPGTEEGEVITLGVGNWSDFMAGIDEGALSVGGDDEDSGYVSKADPTAGTVTSEQDNAVLRAVNEMRAAVEAQYRDLSERVERLERCTESLGGS